jgi:hypothetical protein
MTTGPMTNHTHRVLAVSASGAGRQAPLGRSSSAFVSTPGRQEPAPITRESMLRLTMTYRVDRARERLEPSL